MMTTPALRLLQGWQQVALENTDGFVEYRHGRNGKDRPNHREALHTDLRAVMVEMISDLPDEGQHKMLETVQAWIQGRKSGFTIDKTKLLEAHEEMPERQSEVMKQSWTRVKDMLAKSANAIMETVIEPPWKIPTQADRREAEEEASIRQIHEMQLELYLLKQVNDCIHALRCTMPLMVERVDDLRSSETEGKALAFLRDFLRCFGIGGQYSGDRWRLSFFDLIKL